MTRMYVLVNKDLDMSKGKVSAQVAHAVARLKAKPAHTVIVLGATTEQLHNLKTYLDERKIKNHLYTDEGANEVPPYSVTAMAVEPMKELDTDFGPTTENSEIFNGFRLYKDDYEPCDPYWWISPVLITITAGVFIWLSL